MIKFNNNTYKDLPIKDVNAFTVSIVIIASLTSIIYVLYQLLSGWNFNTELPVIQITLQSVLLVGIMQITMFRNILTEFYINVIKCLNNVYTRVYVLIHNKQYEMIDICISQGFKYNFIEKNRPILVDLKLDDNETIKSKCSPLKYQRLFIPVDDHIERAWDCIKYNNSKLVNNIKIIKCRTCNKDAVHDYKIKNTRLIRYILNSFFISSKLTPNKLFNSNDVDINQCSHSNIGFYIQQCKKYFIGCAYNLDFQLLDTKNHIYNPEYTLWMKINDDSWRSRLDMSYQQIVLDFKNKLLYEKVSSIQSTYHSYITNIYNHVHDEYIKINH